MARQIEGTVRRAIPRPRHRHELVIDELYRIVNFPDHLGELMNTAYRAINSIKALLRENEELSDKLESTICDVDFLQHSGLGGGIF